MRREADRIEPVALQLAAQLTLVGVEVDVPVQPGTADSSTAL